MPCQTHHSTQVLTCHRLGCDLDVTRLPGIVLSQRGSSLQDALEILLSDTLAESGLPRERIGCLLLLTTLTILSVFPLCTCDSGRPESGVTWRLLGIACGTCAWQANISSWDHHSVIKTLSKAGHIKRYFGTTLNFLSATYLCLSRVLYN